MNNFTTVNVIKASGEYEPFSEEKVRSSLKRAGADQNLIARVLSHIKGELYEGIPTQKIYAHIFDILRHERASISSRYNLKEAIMQLGPTGFPFERFVAGIFAVNGYEVAVDKIAQGKCVAHEIDVVAQKDGRNFMIECKYHNRPGTKTDVKVALYVQARFLDVQNFFNQGWLVTNTKATIEACDYAQCVGLKLISWDWPAGESLRDLIEKSGLHPVTSLDFLSHGDKQMLLAKGIVFQKDLPKDYLKERKE
ncbi:MAG: restriction endonuclease [bacterium]|nr:restriction endonuclease [bacterium]